MTFTADFLGFAIKEGKDNNQYAILNFCDTEGSCHGFYIKDLSNVSKLEKYKPYNVEVSYTMYNGKGNFKVTGISKVG